MFFKVVIVCNKRDYYLTKILIGSVRYYYPQIEIFLIKDFLNGFFDTTEAEQYLGVKILDLGIKKYGWSAAKMHFLFSSQFAGQKFIVLDSDIVFAGRFLENLFEESKGYDIGVSADFHDNPYDEFVATTYYDYNFLKTYNPDFNYPGYLFNCGQMVVLPGVLKQEEVSDFFDLKQFPFWKKSDVMPLVDQSLLNYILPLKEQQGTISIYKGMFMVWSETEKVKSLELKAIKKGDCYSFLIHWAGAVRVPVLDKMTRPDILYFFEKCYYSHVPGGKIKRVLAKIYPYIDYYSRKFYRDRCKPILTTTGLIRSRKKE